MSGYDDIEIEGGGGKFLKIEAGKSVNINVLTKREDIVIRQVHWTGVKYAPCQEFNCPDCKVGNKPMTRYKINVFDRADNTVKIFEFGGNVMIGIREIAIVLKEDGMTIHDVDLRISRVSENPVRYQVIQRKKMGDIPGDVLLYDLKEQPKEPKPTPESTPEPADDTDVPF